VNAMIKVGAKTAFIATGSPSENGYSESFNSGFWTSSSTLKLSQRFARHRS
jgi:hypothetical protein